MIGEWCKISTGRALFRKNYDEKLTHHHDFRLKRYRSPIHDAALPQLYDRNPIKINCVNISTFHLLYFNTN